MTRLRIFLAMFVSTLQIATSMADAESAAAMGAQTGIDARAFKLVPDLIRWRRDIHQHPELGNMEHRTAALVEKHLRELGMEVVSGVGGTGVVGILRGARARPVVALRADMDALPVKEQSGLSFASTATATYRDRIVPVMHACGHDAHTAMLMAVASVLSGMKDRLQGTVKFIFQPAEEGPADWAPDGGRTWGAERMIAEGVLRNPDVDAIFALHVVSDLPAGHLAWRAGPATASNDVFEIDVRGAQTHGAAPWRGVDPIVVASQIVLGIQTIASRQVDVTHKAAVISIGTIHGGEKSNIIPQMVQMTGTIRTYDQRLREDLHVRLRRTADLIASSAGAQADVRVVGLQDPGINDPELTMRMSPTLERVAALTGHRTASKVMGAEDFSSFQREVPGLIFLLGVVPRGQGAAAAPNHSPRFVIDESALVHGVRALAGLAIDYLEDHPQRMTQPPSAISGAKAR